MACKHFQQESNNFNKHAKFTIIDQLKNTHQATYRKRKFLSYIRLSRIPFSPLQLGHYRAKKQPF